MSVGVRAVLAGVAVGDGLPVAVMGALNVSPESFHAGSIHRDAEALVRAALAMVDAGASFIDVGARSTAPYLDTEIGLDEEADRLSRAVGALAGKLPVPVSADTPHAAPAAAALEAGARIINDVSGLAEPALARLVAVHEVGLIAMASPAAAGAGPPRGGRAPSADEPTAPSDEGAGPVATVRGILERVLERAVSAAIPHQCIVLDPGIGFFRAGPIPWDVWDVEILAGLAVLRDLGRPLCVGVSRKSFLGAIADRPHPADRLAASLAATALAVASGAAVIRTHDVAETLDAIRVAERVRRATRT